MSTRRMLAFCRAVERLTSRDMRTLMVAIYPKGDSFDAISRDNLMRDILRLSKATLEAQPKGDSNGR